LRRATRCADKGLVLLGSSMIARGGIGREEATARVVAEGRRELGLC
jgi:hypothetical protein